MEKELLEVGAHLTIGAYHKPSYGADIDEPLLRWADVAWRGAGEERVDLAKGAAGVRVDGESTPIDGLHAHRAEDAPASGAGALARRAMFAAPSAPGISRRALRDAFWTDLRVWIKV